MMDSACSMQLIDRDGKFNVNGAQQFFKEFKLEESGLSVVSIIGAQCSGKSTLLNHLFGTNFRELDASKGRFGTTEGIWIARCADIEPCTIVMDIEGTDGRERGEEDTSFEKQSALFAFVISDIVIINIHCHDIGLEKGAGMPLLKIVFKAMLYLFSSQKTTLMFMIRDKTRTPLENLESVLRIDIQKQWDSIIKPEAHIKTLLNEFFNIEVVALSSYEETNEQFKVEVANLRQRFIDSVVPSRLASDGRRRVSGNGFALDAEQKWQMIKNYKDLNIPPYRVMLASVHCEEIVRDKVSHFMENKDLLQLSTEVERSAHVIGFGKRLSSILQSTLSEFDMKSRYYDKNVKFSKREQLQNNLLCIVEPIFKNAIEHLRLRTFEKFIDTYEKASYFDEGLASSAHFYVHSCMSQFDKDCKEFVIKEANWDTSRTREKLQHHIQSYVESIRVANLSKLTSLCETKLKKALDGPVEALLEIANDATWPFIRNLVTRETKLACHGFDIDEKTEKKMLSDLEKYAHGLVEAKVREESAQVLRLMVNRFATIFKYDSDSFPRCYTKMEDIKEITKMARVESLKVLSVLAVIRFDDKDDNVETILSLALINSTNMESLASNTWEEVTPTKTLITPLQCISIWSKFKDETGYIVRKAISTQQAEERDNNCICPSWVKKLFE